MLNFCAPFDLRFTLSTPADRDPSSRLVRLRGIYPAPRVARRTGVTLAARLGWIFLDATPALRQPDLDTELPLLEAIEARPRTDELAYGVVSEPPGPRYLLLSFGHAWPLMRFARRADPAIQITELCHCLRLGFGQG